MRRPFVYDITRLVTRIFARTPNGIDRVDYAFARHALEGEGPRAGAIITPFGPRIVPAAAALEVLDNVRRHWGEDENAKRDPNTLAILAALDDPPSPTPRISVERRGQYWDAWAWTRRHGFRGEPIGRFLAKGGFYLNVSQFPLSVERAFRWLKLGGGIEGVFYIHDLLPLDMPEFFRPKERTRHANRLAALAAHGHAAIVSSSLTCEALAREMAERGRQGLPILVAPPPADPSFANGETDLQSRKGHPYFVMLGTIEPRKNHLFILQVWREMVTELGATAPKLVLVGERGWENEQVMDLIERSPPLKSHVVLMSGLSTPRVRLLLLGARALLAPSFAEGYGLPIVEGLAAGIPVLASDIPIFREIWAERAVLIDPIDGPGWRRAILERSRNGPPVAAPDDRKLAGWDETLARVEAFLDSLPPATSWRHRT